MKRTAKILAFVLCTALALSGYTMLAKPAFAEDVNYSTAANTPFSSVTDNGVSYRLSDTVKNEDGTYTVKMDTAVVSQARLFYGEGSIPYGVDMKNFQMNFSVDQLTAVSGQMARFSIAFLGGSGHFPMDNYGRGLGLYFIDWGNAYQVCAYAHTESGQALIGTESWLVYNNNGRPDHFGKDITLSLTESDADNLLLDIRFTVDEGTTEADTVASRTLIPKATLAGTGIDTGSAVLFFSPRENISGDFIFTVNSIAETNTTAYLESAARTETLAKLNDLQAAFEGFTTYGDYADYITANNLNLGVLRAYDKADNASWIDGAYNTLLGTLIGTPASEIEAISDFTSNVRNNQDGSYAEFLESGKEKIVIVNRFVTDGSSIALKKAVDISDFKLEYQFDKLIDTRFSLVFGPSLECYNYGTMTVPGLAVTLMTSGTSMNIFIENTAGASPIAGVNTNEWHILKDGSGNWLTLPIAAGQNISVSLKQEEGGIRLTVTSGGASGDALIPADFFTGNSLDVSNMYFKYCAGHQANAFGTEKYLEMTINSISDASNAAAVTLIENFIADAENVAGLEGAIALLEQDISLDMLYMQQTQLAADLGAALDSLRGFVNTEMSTLANAFGSESANLDDVSSGVLTQAKIDTAKAKQSAYYGKADYLDYLTVTQVNALNAIVSPADYKVLKAEIYLKVNAYTAAAEAISNKEDVTAAKALRGGITAADINQLEEADKADVNGKLVAADQKVADKETSLNAGCNNGCAGVFTGEGSVIIVIMLAAAFILFIAKRKNG